MQSAETIGLISASAAPPMKRHRGHSMSSITDADVMAKRRAVGQLGREAQQLTQPLKPRHSMVDADMMHRAATVAAEQMADSGLSVSPLGNALLVESITGLGHGTGLLEASLLATIVPRVTKLGYFRLLSKGSADDPKLKFMRAMDKFNLNKEPIDSMIGVTVDEASHMYAQSGGQSDEIFGTIIDRFQQYAADKDFVMVSGERITARGASSAGAPPGSAPFYLKLANALNLPVLVVHDVTDTEDVESLGEGLEVELLGIQNTFKDSSVRLAGAIVTGLAVKTYERESKKMRDAMEKLVRILALALACLALSCVCCVR